MCAEKEFPVTQREQEFWTRRLVRGIAGAGSGNTDFVISAGGIVADLDASTYDPIAKFPMRTARGGRLLILGTGKENDAINFRIWGVDRVFASRSGVLSFIGSGVATLGDINGFETDGDIILKDDLLADTIVWTIGTSSTSPKGVGDLIGDSTASLYSMGNIGAYSPTDDTPAMLLIPHFPFSELWVDFDMSTGDPAAGNALFIRNS